MIYFVGALAIVGVLIGASVDAYGKRAGWSIVTRILVSWCVCAVVAAIYLVVVL